MTKRRNPIIIQGGMGAAVSSWLLARTVSKAGQLGVVSGTGLDAVFIRRLQLGDPGGELRWALDRFPNPRIARRILDHYFLPDGKKPNEPFRATPVPHLGVTPEAIELLVVANFVEVCLAKREHDGLVGINYLEKIQLPTLPSIFGAMLAGVDFVLMGAGIPRLIPGILDRLSRGERVALPLNVEEAAIDDEFNVEFDPATILDGRVPPLARPRFLAIVSSTTLATMLVRKSTGRVDGFVVEGPTAGGHNAPPRGPKTWNDRGEPVYGERDVPDLAVFRSLGVPFWLAGSYGSSEHVIEALAAGAAGVQVGTAFAFCDESALEPDVKRRTIEMCRRGQCDVFTDSAASPAGFPFKVLRLDGSLSDVEVYEARRRVC
ncbi:MAG: nitronate monooxygenase, partial [Pirellulaceae bacterium]|nr:nitronate monooxygenase [Pirellulaceae bacterium]